MRTTTTTNLLASLAWLATTVIAADLTPVADLFYSRTSDFPLAVELKVGSPQQKLLAQLDTQSRDILLSTEYDAVSSIFDTNSFNFNADSSSSFSTFSGTSWGSDNIGFRGSDATYQDVLFGLRASESVPSVFSLGHPNIYKDDKNSFWDALASQNITKSYSIGFADAPEDAPGVYSAEDAATVSGLIVFGGVAQAYYNSLTILPLASNDDLIGFTLTAVGVQADTESSPKTISAIKHLAVVKTRGIFPSMPKQLVENIVTSLDKDTELTTGTSGLYEVDCDTEFTLLFNFQGAVIRIPSTELLTESDDGSCSLAIIPSDSDEFVIAGGMLTYFYFVVDFENDQISIGQSKFPGANVDPEIETYSGSVSGAKTAAYYSETFSSQLPEPTSDSSLTSEATTDSSTHDSSSADQTVTPSSSESSSTITGYNTYPYTNTSSSSSSSSSLASSTSTSTSTVEAPTISGSFINGQLQWTVNIPASIGPFNAFSYEGTGEGYTITNVKLNGRDLTSESGINGAGFSLDTTDINGRSESLTLVYTAIRFDSTTLFSSDGTLAITRPNRKREVLIYELSYTIDTALGYAVTNSDVEETSSVATSTDVTSVLSTTVVTATSCSMGICMEAPITTGVTVATSTVHGTVTSFTTYCPLSTESFTDSTTPIVTPSTVSLSSTFLVTSPFSPSTEVGTTSTPVINPQLEVQSSPALSSSSITAPSILTYSGGAVGSFTSITNLLFVFPLLLLI